MLTTFPLASFRFGAAQAPLGRCSRAALDAYELACCACNASGDSHGLLPIILECLAWRTKTPSLTFEHENFGCGAGTRSNGRRTRTW